SHSSSSNASTARAVSAFNAEQFFRFDSNDCSGTWRSKGVYSEIQPESVYEIQQAEQAYAESNNPHDLLPAESGNCRERNADLEHGYGIGKSMMVVEALVRLRVSGLHFFFKFLRLIADFLLLRQISIGFLAGFAGKFRIGRL